MVSTNALLQSGTSHLSSNTLTLTLIMFMPQIACEEMRISHIQKSNTFDIFVYHNYTIDYLQKQ